MMTIEQLERHWHQRAQAMTLAEIETELEKLTISPKTDRELIGRAVMARRRIELVDVSKPSPQAPPPDPIGMVDVVSRVGGLETQVVDVVRQTTTALEAFEHEIAHVTAENIELKAKLLQLETSLAELRLAEARASGKTIESSMVRVN